MSRLPKPIQLLAFAATLAIVFGASFKFAAAPDSRVAGDYAPPPTVGGQPERHLILLPGGGFMTYDSGFQGRMVPAAIAAGFVPHYLEYRLDDLPGAIRDVRSLADRLVAEHGRENVFVYGSSAGGTLATYLAGEARVAAAVASSALYDFRDWPWVSLYRDPEFFDRIRLGPDARSLLSPIRRPLRCPLLAMHGTRDPIVSYFQAVDFSILHRRATLRRSNGGHGIYRTRPHTVAQGMRWLHATADAQARIERHLRLMDRARLRSQVRGDGPRAVRMLNRKMRDFEAARAPRLCASPRPLAFARSADGR